MNSFSEVPKSERGVDAASRDQTLGRVAGHVGQFAVVAGERLEEGSRFNVVKIRHSKNHKTRHDITQKNSQIQMD